MMYSARVVAKMRKRNTNCEAPADFDEILEASRLLRTPGTVTEVRLPGTARGTVSGYYDDLDKQAHVAAHWSGKAPAVHVTLNPVNPALLSRACNRLIEYAKNTTSDTDIIRRHWLPLDFDPIRPAGISSTDAEHAAALERARECLAWLRSLGFSTLILADSGNGGHVLARIDLPNDQDSTALVRRCIEAVALRFSDDTVSVDLSVFNAARIWKAYGTLACKGDSTPDRPHRLARVLEAPALLAPEPRALLKQLAALVPDEPKRHARQIYNGSTFDLSRWIADRGLDVRGPYPWQNGQRWAFSVCPWDPAHTNRGAAYLLQFPSGAIAAGCHHNTCSGRDWHALRDVVEPGWREKKTRNDPSYTNGRTPPPESTWNEDDENDYYTRQEREPEETQEQGTFLPVIVPAQTVKPEAVNYLWPPYFPLAKLCLLGGDSGAGKTYLTLSVTTSHSVGNWPFYFAGKESARDPGNTIIFSTEDGLADTLVPRLTSLGADLSRVSFVEGKKDWEGNLHRVVLTDADVISRAIADCKARLAFFDPFQGFLPPKTKMNDMETVRPVVSALIRIAKETQCCIVLVGHLSKAKQESTAYKFIGSVDWFAAARSALLVIKDPEAAPEGRLFYQVKNSLCATPPGVRFAISEKTEPPFLWGKSTDQTCEDVVTGRSTSGTKTDDAETFLKEELSQGERPVDELKESAKKLGVSWRTIWEAKRHLKIRARKDGFQGPWLWALPPKDADYGTATGHPPVVRACTASAAMRFYD